MSAAPSTGHDAGNGGLELIASENIVSKAVLEAWEDRPHPQTVAVAGNLFAVDARVREHVLNALDQGATEVTLWGDSLPAELDESVDSVQHRLSAAARAFKAQALAAANAPDAAVEDDLGARELELNEGQARHSVYEPVGVSNYLAT